VASQSRTRFASSRILLEHDPPVLETACFHCQQAVEKALKAFLVCRGVSFEKVHSLTYLLDLCEVQEPGFASLRNMAETLAPYAVMVRYPGEPMDISQEEAQQALATAQTMWDFILNLIEGIHCC
jgi:HEPN domain-containing protein